MSTLLSVVAMLACGIFGALAGWSAMTALGWSGTGAAVLAAIIGMVVATLGWIAGVAVRNRMSGGGGPGGPGKASR
jgi:hypothetical protein